MQLLTAAEHPMLTTQTMHISLVASTVNMLCSKIQLLTAAEHDISHASNANQSHSLYSGHAEYQNKESAHVESSDDGEAAHKLRDEAIAHEVCLLHLLQHTLPKRLACPRLMPRPACTTHCHPFDLTTSKHGPHIVTHLA
jgi:hypothetical protein